MKRIVLILAAMAASLAPALAQEPAIVSKPACEACRTADIDQLGSYAPDDLSIRHTPDYSDDIKGKARKIPVPGVGSLHVRLKPGAGVWLGEVPAEAGQSMGDVFAAPLKGGARAQWRFGF
ncbi:MAG: hypothetical protein FJX29_10275 [Alphaproteobacteria bacterium]|nr:hypothetical protein [Alphaproteobacteria bacterium]